MFELIMGVLAVVAVAKVASADDQSPVLWGAVMLLLGIGSIVLLPSLPFLRIGLAFVLTFVAMIGYKVYADR